MSAGVAWVLVVYLLEYSPPVIEVRVSPTEASCRAAATTIMALAHDAPDPVRAAQAQCIHAH